MTKFKLSKIKMSSKYVDRKTDADGWEHHAWRVTLSYQRRSVITAFHTGTGCTGDPQPLDVLGCLQSEASSGDQSFEDFAAELLGHAKRQPARP